MLRTHTCGELSKNDAGKKITLAGWVDSARISGKIGFLDLRDRYGKTQVFLNKDLANEFRNLNKEDILQVEGEVKTRPPQQVKELGTGEIEVSATKIILLKKIPPLPLDLGDEITSSEETRMKFRYLDLRRPEVKDALIIRHKLTMAIRKFMDQENFLEIETPFMAKSTPEGSRDYIVPSRNFPGQFYALPQSPQIYKQLLMVGGMDKYFQIVRCFRDEDLRADRQPEFTQLDIEMSFVEEEDVYTTMEKLMQYIFKEVLNQDIAIPFPRLTYDQVMEKYKSDQPDTREETGLKYSFLWVTEFPMFEFSNEANRYIAMHHPFTSPKMEDMKYIHNDKDKVRSRAYDLVLNGSEIGGGSIRISDEAVQKEVFTAIGLSEKEAEKKFGCLLNALKYAPPHGGLAFGLDRWAMIMAGKNSIRDVIAFPKNKDARCLMMDAPSEVSGEQLDEVGLKLK
ncbi:MAG: aspartate--tRNA ligase [Nanoarchaeota archaeon]|nr:aspartate--tRNA ligase [Nanoarchaeota archaeon]MBU1623244.1 aspartate--tRNA ligase [Nanoarchaeota archaeon]